MNTQEVDFMKRRGVTDEGQDVKAFQPPELSAQDYAEHTANQTATGLQSTKLFEVVEVQAGIGQVHILGRVRAEDERDFVEKVVSPVLTTINNLKDCEGHVCKQFILKNGKVRYAWAISFAANDLRTAANAICEAAQSAVPPKQEVVETPLRGKGTPQGAGPRGGRKGAAPIK